MGTSLKASICQCQIELECVGRSLQAWVYQNRSIICSSPSSTLPPSSTGCFSRFSSAEVHGSVWDVSVPLGSAGLPPGRQVLCWAQPGAAAVPGASWLSESVSLEATGGASPGVNAVRTRVFGSSLLPLIQGIQKMQVGLGAESTWWSCRLCSLGKPGCRNVLWSILVRSVFDGVRSIHFSRCTVRVQAKLDGMPLPPPSTASYSLGTSSQSFQMCLLAQRCQYSPDVEEGCEEWSAGEDSASVHCNPHPLQTIYII